MDNKQLALQLRMTQAFTVILLALVIWLGVKQNQEPKAPDSIALQKIDILDEKGQSVITLSGKDGGRIDLRHNNGSLVAQLGTGIPDMGTGLKLLNPGEQNVLVLSSTDSGGYMRIKNSSGHDYVSLIADWEGKGNLFFKDGKGSPEAIHSFPPWKKKPNGWDDK